MCGLCMSFILIYEILYAHFTVQSQNYSNQQLYSAMQLL